MPMACRRRRWQTSPPTHAPPVWNDQTLACVSVAAWCYLAVQGTVCGEHVVSDGDANNHEARADRCRRKEGGTFRLRNGNVYETIYCGQIWVQMHSPRSSLFQVSSQFLRGHYEFGPSTCAFVDKREARKGSHHARPPEPKGSGNNRQVAGAGCSQRRLLPHSSRCRHSSARQHLGEPGRWLLAGLFRQGAGIDDLMQHGDSAWAPAPVLCRRCWCVPSPRCLGVVCQLH